MRSSLRLALTLLAVPLAVGVLVAARHEAGRNAGLTVHEWGTFTSVAGEDGNAIDWTPLSAPSDLPCFVKMLNPNSIKGSEASIFIVDTTDHPLANVRATVRMETPVMYFYSAAPVDVQVGVQFPHGLITEWYPQATVPFVPMGNADLQRMTGAIDWQAAHVRPDDPAVFPREASPSPYYAARETDAAPVEVGGQREKFLFYRGIAAIPVPVRARLDEDDGSVLVETTKAEPIPSAILFVNEGGRIGYRVVDDIRTPTRLAPPPLTGNMDSLAADLRTRLIARGLFPREAAAMVETWRSSWFEEGTRVLYILPHAWTDTMLPATITPAPAELDRVFVGRIEIVTPAIEAAVSTAIRHDDAAAEIRYGRFLEPIATRLLAQAQAGLARSQVEAAVRRILAARTTASVRCGSS